MSVDTPKALLLIPLWLMLVPGRVRPARVVAFLATVAAFYWVLGMALLLGAGAVHEAMGDWLATDPARYSQLTLGVVMVAGSFLIGRNRTSTAADGGARPGAPGRISRWRSRAMRADGGGLGSLLLLALGAALVESASMLPYLAGIGLLTAADVPTATAVLVLAAYVVVMVAPALVLLALRILARQLVEPPLRRLEGWLSRSAGEMTAWIVGIVGFLLARDAAAALELFGQG